MENTNSQSHEAMAVYEAYWDTYLKGDLETWASLVDDDFRVIGSTDGEIFHNKKETLSFYEATAEQVVGKVEIRNSIKKMKAFDELVLITEVGDLYLLMDNEWTFYSRFCLSSLLKKNNNSWKFIQQHGSIPDMRAEEGEQVGFEKIKQENFALRDAVKRRTVELENKNRELEIQGSLERVRAIALSMQKPSDMLDVCRVISQQLESLDVTDIRNVQTVIIDELKGTYQNYQYFSAYGKTVTEETQSEKHPTVLAMVQEMKKSADAYFSGRLDGEGLESFRKYRQQENQFDDPLLDETKSVYYCFFSIGKGGLGITTYKPLPESALEIFKRFHNVFQLAYRRFIDIEKAEAQAREAQIEAALERVRGKAMAMHSSEDLSSTVGIFFKQLKGLGIIPIRCGVGQIDEPTRTTNLTTTTSSQLGDSFEVIGKVKQTGHPVLDGIFENWKLQKEYHPVLKGEDIKAYYSVMNRQINYPEYREDVTQYGNMFYFKEGFVFAWTENELSEKDLKIFRRFTSVLSLTYRRYLDLKEAEAQAREAQVELALERIRAQVTAMRESSELLDIVVMMQAEFIKLGHEAHYFWHMRWLPDKYEKALTNGEGTRIGNVLELPRGFHGLQTMLDWEKSDDPVAVFALEPETAADYIDKMIKLGRFQEIDHTAPDPDTVRAMGGLTFVMARTTHGEIGYTLPGEVPHPPEEDIATLVRFAHVFDLAYRRFEDLKSAERQNRIIQAENERKSKELEEARQMQLAMLPKEIPQLENLEIAVHMQTATEVGGDYYDFSTKADGSINICLGDATGHGMKAGIMVSLMKSIFTTNSPKMDIESFFATANSGIKSMGLKQMMMGFTMLNINHNTFKLINAGLPAIFMFCKKHKSVNEIKEHGIPIGAMKLFHYQAIDGKLEKGDVLLLLTDGMPELQNRNNEMYGYERIRNGFKKVADKEPEEIVNFLRDEGSTWIGDRNPEDDVTFVVVKVK